MSDIDNFVRVVLQVDNRSYLFERRQMVLKCYRLTLSCGHSTYRRYIRARIICLSCHKAARSYYQDYDEVGQRLFNF